MIEQTEMGQNIIKITPFSLSNRIKKHSQSSKKNHKTHNH